MSSSRSTTGVDDIDGDDTPTTTTTTTAAASTAAAASVDDANRAAEAAPSSPRFVPSSSLDDIDDDTPASRAPIAATAATSSASAAAASSSSNSAAASSSAAAAPAVPLTAAEEVARILDVLASDARIANLLAPSGSPSLDSSSSRSGAVAVADHFAIMNLPPPAVNAAGEGVWLVTDDALKRAFKRLVLLIHPDKTPVARAKDAFESVKEAHACLASDTARYDYVKAYTAMRRNLAQRDASFVPLAAGVGSASLEETLLQGRVLAAIKSKQVSAFAAKLQAQAEAKLAAARAGEAARAKREQEAREADIKRKIVQDSDHDDSDGEGAGRMSVADKIRAAKGAKPNKKIRML